MKAILQHSYGSAEVFELGEVPPPTIRENQVLVRVRATSMHPDVWHMMTGLPYVLRLMGAGLRRPNNPVPGTDLAGVVEAVGAAVTRFRVGDEVFGESIANMQWINGGAFAELVAVEEDNLEFKPARVGFEAAASVCTAGVIVLSNLRDRTEPRAGQRVLVNGAGGGVGSIVLQFAKARGAHVTAVELPEKLALVQQLGADVVVDGSTSIVSARREGVVGDPFDLIVDIPTNYRFSEWRPLLKPDGIYVPIGHDHFGRAGRHVLGLVPSMLALGLRAYFSPQLQRLIFSWPSKRESLATLAALLESGRLTPVIDRAFPLAEAADAMRYLESGRAGGRIVLTM